MDKPKKGEKKVVQEKKVLKRGGKKSPKREKVASKKTSEQKEADGMTKQGFSEEKHTQRILTAEGWKRKKKQKLKEN